MNRITIGEAEKAAEGKLISGNRDEYFEDVSMDSRKAGAGSLFVPIIGEIHDAHKFIPKAYENGCRNFFVSDSSKARGLEDCNVILVDDTTKAVQKLAAWYLAKLDLKVIAVTGSVGKTGTRDMVYHILSEKFKTGTTAGNYNNDIGVPMTIFTFDDSLEAAVLEVGMDHAGEIRRLVGMVKPDTGIITNVGVSHLENLGTREAIRDAKLEITTYFGEDNTLVINCGNDMLKDYDFDGNYKVIRAGMGKDSQYVPYNIEDKGAEGIGFSMKTPDGEADFDLPVPGAHNAVNACLAAAACSTFGISAQDAAKGLSKMKLTGSRLTVKEHNGITIIDDTYNAAPDSVKSAINTLMNTKGKRKIAVLGGMNELGKDSALYHRKVGEHAADMGTDVLVTLGEKAYDIAEGARSRNGSCQVIHFDEMEELKKEIADIVKEGDTVLFKASRSLKMEEAVSVLLNI